MKQKFIAIGIMCAMIASAGLTAQAYEVAQQQSSVAVVQQISVSDNSTSEFELSPDSKTLVKYNGSGGEVTIPDTVTTIGRFAFSSCSNLTKVNLSNGLTIIESGAFSRCTKLSGTIEIPETVTEISATAFDYCENIEAFSVAEGNGKYSAENGVLYNKNKTSLIRVPGKLEGIFSIPKTVVAIKTDAFCSCKQLTGINGGDNVTAIGSYAFENCAALRAIQIPNSVTTIGASAFSNCRSLTSVTIGGNITYIGNYTFENCTALTNVYIKAEEKPANASFGKNVFKGCGISEFTYDADINLSFSTSLKKVDDDSFDFSKPLQSGSTVKLTVTPTYSVGDCVYSYSVRYPGESVWHDLEASSDTLEFGNDNTQKEGIYYISVQVSDDKSSVTQVKAFSVVPKLEVSVALDRYELHKSEAVTVFTNLTQGNSGNYIFHYQVSKGSDSDSAVYNVAGTKHSLSIKPSKGEGDYKISVTVTDRYGYSVTSDTELSIIPNMTCDASIDHTAVQKGDAVHITATPKDELGDCTYSYYYRYRTENSGEWKNNGEWKAIRKDVTDSSIEYLPMYTGYYQFRIVVKDSHETTAENTEYSIKVNKQLSVSKPTLSYTTVQENEEVKLTATAMYGVLSDDSEYTYTYSIRKENEDFQVLTLNEDSIFSCPEAGKYYIKVVAKDSLGHEVESKETALTVNNAIECSKLKLDKTVVQQGENVKLTAVASGGVGSYTYKFQCKEQSQEDSKYTDLIGTISKNGITFKLSEAGTYDVKAIVTDAHNNEAEMVTSLTVNEALSCGVEFDKAVVQQGENVKLTAVASGGVGSYTYKFQCKEQSQEDAKYTDLIGTISKNGITFKLSEAGTYDVKAIVTDAHNNEAEMVTSLTVNEALSCTLSGKSIVQKNDAVQLSATVSGGVGDYTYAYYVKKQSASGWSRINGDPSEYTPPLTGIYDFKVFVTDENGNNVEAKLNGVVVKKPLSAGYTVQYNNGNIVENGVTPTVQVGEKVIVNAVAEGGTENYKYNYLYKNPGDKTWREVFYDSTSSKFEFTPAMAGVNKVKVVVTDGDGHEAYTVVLINVNESLSCGVELDNSSVSRNEENPSVTLTAWHAENTGVGECNYSVSCVFLQQELTDKEDAFGAEGTKPILTNREMEGSTYTFPTMDNKKLYKGYYYFKITATDMNGNEAESNVVVLRVTNDTVTTGGTTENDDVETPDMPKAL